MTVHAMIYRDTPTGEVAIPVQGVYLGSYGFDQVEALDGFVLTGSEEGRAEQALLDELASVSDDDAEGDVHSDRILAQQELEYLEGPEDIGRDDFGGEW